MKWGDGIDWDQEARRADAENLGPARGAGVVERAVRLCPPPGRVLDLGCNIGRFAAPFIEAGYSYVGVDQAAGALAIARLRNPEIDFRQAWLWDVVFEGELFDVAFTNAVLQHNTHVEKELILTRVRDLVRPGGVFLIQESTVAQQTRTQLTHQGWINLGERHGFRLLETAHRNPEGVDDAYAFIREGWEVGR